LRRGIIKAAYLARVAEEEKVSKNEKGEAKRKASELANDKVVSAQVPVITTIEKNDKIAKDEKNDKSSGKILFDKHYAGAQAKEANAANKDLKLIENQMKRKRDAEHKRESQSKETQGYNNKKTTHKQSILTSEPRELSLETKDTVTGMLSHQNKSEGGNSK
jgi:hypothetical protein